MMGTKPDIRDSIRRTPLSRAAENGHEEIIKLLLATGKVDIDAKNRYGMTPLSWAVENGHEAVIKLLLVQGAQANSKDNIKRTPLSYAAKNGHVGVVTTLLANDMVDLDSDDHYGSTPLSIAIRNGHIEVTKLLLDKERVSFNSRDYFRRTPLWYATRYGISDIAQPLLNHAERGGISVCENELPVDVSLRPHDAESGWCDICTMSIEKDDTYCCCEGCCDGKFWACLECYKIGGSCLEVDHELIQKKDDE
ncbi:ankyrin repeat-containing domain protein [Phaeosphaeriaceae sp. PMI808]|nr:ankyrin repeat-containing domain protein [Phaeosphaeriaceae sp. PMI808]